MPVSKTLLANASAEKTKSALVSTCLHVSMTEKKIIEILHFHLFIFVITKDTGIVLEISNFSLATEKLAFMPKCVP